MLKNCLRYCGIKASLAMRKLFTDERGEVNVVAIVVLIAVAVVLALLLKDRLAELIKSMMTSITSKAGEALNDA